MKYSFLLLTLVLFLGANIAKAQETPLSVTLLPDTLLCHGFSNGEIDFSVFGGNAPYHYEWQKLGVGFVFEQGDIELEGQNQLLGGDLPSGGYVIEVMDANGLRIKDTSYVHAPFPIYVSDITTVYPVCPGECEGSLSLTTGGGTGEILVTWSDVMDTTVFRSQLCEGSYSFFLEDENGCTQKGLADIYDPETLVVEATIENPSCFGQTDGHLSLTIEGGSPPFLLVWENGEEGPERDNLAAGEHQVTITDMNECLLDTFFVVEEGLDVIPNIQINYGCGDGNITVVARPINGTEPYGIAWSNGQEGTVFYGGTAGSYSLTLTDDNNCITTTDFTVDFVPTLELSTQIMHNFCPGDENGGVNVSVSGGLPPFAFSWSNGTEDEDLEGVTGGVYSVNVIAEGCAIGESFTISEPTLFEVNTVFEQQENGQLSATAIANGGTPPYQLEWSTGTVGTYASDLSIGTSFSITITDVHGCTDVFEFEALITNTYSTQLQENVKIFPNPVSNFLNIELQNKPAGNIVVQLYDMKGVLILYKTFEYQQFIKIDMQDLPSGTYITRCSYGQEVSLFKVLKS